ncbi:MAG: hypothetical protein C0459_03255 [Chitinophaga sp.]|jgi:hypothetical protein|nr:hypothetical protein [Chitinophaga sp.]
MSNHVQLLKAQAEYNLKQVLFLCSISEQQLKHFKIDTARAFLEAYYNGLNYDALLDNISFWQWWNFNWIKEDDEWIIAELYKMYETKPKQCYGYYRELHQYLFASGTERHDMLLNDFRNMREYFEKEAA